MNEKNRVEEVNVVFLFTVLTYIVMNGVVGLLYWQFEVSLSSFQRILVAQVTLILPTICYVIKNKINLKQLIRFNKIKLSTVVLLIPFAICISPLMNYISYISMLFFSNHIGNTVEGLIANSNFVVAFILVALVPAIFEETVYRGVFYNEYSKVNMKKAILLSALMFGLLHMNINQFLYAFAIGVIFALLVEATNSIVSTMIVHFVINGSSMLLAKASSMYSKELAQVNSALTQREELLVIIPKLLVPVIIATLIALAIFYVIVLTNNRVEHMAAIFSKEKKKTMKIGSIALLFGIAICIIEMLGQG